MPGGGPGRRGTRTFELLPPLSRARVALAAVVIGPIVMMAHFTARSTFVWDDIVNLREAQLSNLSIGYLVDESPAVCCLGLRLAPVHRLAYWLLQEFSPMNFRIAQATALVCFALVLLVLHRLLVELFGTGPGPLILTLLYGVSTVHVDVIQWWSASLDRLPDTLFSLLVMLFYVRFHRTGARRWLVLSVAALSMALLFHTKAALVPLYVVLLQTFILTPGEPWRDTFRSLTQQWRVWVAYAVPVGTYLAVYLQRYGGEGIADPSLSMLGHYLPILWFRIVAPGLFGVYIPRSLGPAVAVPIMVAAQLALVGAVVWTISRRPAAWRAWVFFLVAFLVNAIVVGLTRIFADTGTVAPNGIAYALRYNEEIAYLVPIAVGAAVLRAGRTVALRGAVEPAHGRTTALVAAGVALFVGFAWVGAGRVSATSVWVGARARPYVEKVSAGLEALRRSARPGALVDGVAPDELVPFVPFNSHSEALRVIDERAPFDTAGRDLFEVAPDGTVVPVTFSAEAGGDAGDLLVARSIDVSPVSPTFDERGMCVRSGAAGALVAFTPLGPMSGGPLYVLLQYGSSSGGLLQLAAELVESGESGTRRFLRMPEGGNQTNVVSLEATELQRLYVGLAADSEFCVTRLELGRLHSR